MPSALKLICLDFQIAAKQELVKLLLSHRYECSSQLAMPWERIQSVVLKVTSVVKLLRIVEMCESVNKSQSTLCFICV